ncbi:MAG: hypothetical protein Q8R08_00890 [bacterium]|nr:hypothetical protein [bacterium]
MPSFVFAHTGEVHLARNPTTLPGESRYQGEKIGEWLDVNLFTLSTKKKQKKKLSLAEERVVEIAALFERQELKSEDLEEGLKRYKYFLTEAGYMAEKIIVLDGSEIALAEEFERNTRTYEEVFSQLLRVASGEVQTPILEALIISRSQNQSIFEFMVRNYQATDADIKKHQEILGEHIELAGSLIDKSDLINYDRVNAKFWLNEARKFQNAGLNVEAYHRVNKAKNLVYSKLLMTNN